MIFTSLSKPRGPCTPAGSPFLLPHILTPHQAQKHAARLHYRTTTEHTPHPILGPHPGIRPPASNRTLSLRIPPISPPLLYAPHSLLLPTSSRPSPLNLLRFPHILPTPHGYPFPSPDHFPTFQCSLRSIRPIPHQPVLRHQQRQATHAGSPVDFTLRNTRPQRPSLRTPGRITRPPAGPRSRYFFRYLSSHPKNSRFHTTEFWGLSTWCASSSKTTSRLGTPC